MENNGDESGISSISEIAKLSRDNDWFSGYSYRVNSPLHLEGWWKLFEKEDG